MLRAFTFYAFVLIYMVFCPLIIFDSLGIVITPTKSKLMMSTGLISIDTIPPGATLYVDGKRYRKKSPAIIRDLAPGRYEIKATLKGYRPWTRAVVVEQEQATVMQSALLIPQQWGTRAIVKEEFTGLSPVDDAPIILLSNNNLLSSLSVFEWDVSLLDRLTPPKEFTPKDWKWGRMIPEPSTGKGAKLGKLITMPQSPYILAYTVSGSGRTALWLNADHAGEAPVDVTTLLAAMPDTVRWDADDPKNLFYVSGQSLTRVNLAERKSYGGLAPGMKGFALLNKKIYWIDAGDRFFESDYDLNDARPLTGDLAHMPDTFQGETIFHIHAFSDNDFLFIDSNGRLLSNRLPFKLVDGEVAGFNRRLNEGRLLFWTRKKLGLIEFGRSRKEGVFEMGPGLTWLVQDAKNISQAFWVNRGSHVLFRDQDRVKLVDISQVSAPEVITLVESSAPVAYSDGLGRLFYLDNKTQYLMELTVLPAHEYASFILPPTFHKKDMR